MNKSIIKYLFHFISLISMLVVTLVVFIFSIKPNNWIEISLAILVFNIVTFLFMIIFSPKAKKVIKDSEDMTPSLNEEDVETKFLLNYSGLNIIFKEKGLYFVEDNGFISYDKIVFTAYVTNDYKKKIYNLNIEINNTKIEESDNDYIKLSKDVVYWINKYNILVNNLDVINQENKELVTEKFKINQYNSSLLLILSWIIMLFFFGIAISFKNIIIGILISSFPTNVIASIALNNRKTLVITNLGVTLKQRVTSVKDQLSVTLDNSLHIPYYLIESITINDKLLIINGRYSKIDFKYKPKVLDIISKYLPKEKINIK